MSYEADQQSYNNATDSNDSRECEAMRKMFVGGLSRNTKEEAFFNYFGQFGEMVDKVIICDSHTKESRGFGFITYAKSDSVEQVFSTRPHVLDDKTLDVKRAMPREFNTTGAHSKTNKLFVGGFKGLDFKPEELQQYIESRHPSSFGHIESIDFLKDKDSGNYKGFGFIMCSSTDFADRLAISEMSFYLKGRNMSIKKAEPREGTAAPSSGGMSRGGGRGGNTGGRGGRGGSGGGRGGRGGAGPRGGRGGGRGGYSNGGGNFGEYSTSYPSYGGNDYQQNQNFGGGYQQGYGQNQGGYGGNFGGGYNQGYNQGGGYDNSYGSQGSYGGGRGAGRGASGGQRYQPY